MDGAKITDPTSQAYKLIQTLHVENGLYSDGKYVAVAMASYYGEVGDKFRITLSSGQVFYGIMTDTKQTIHVDRNYAHKVDGSVIEFVVDIETLDPKIKTAGDLSVIYKGGIEKIERLEK